MNKFRFIFCLMLYFATAISSTLNLGNLPEENPIIQTLNAEKDEVQKTAMLEQLKTTCPFKRENDAAGILVSSLSLSNRSTANTAQQIECDKYLNEFNETSSSISVLQNLVESGSNPSSTDSGTQPVAQDSTNVALVKSITNSTNLKNLLESKCAFSNSSGDNISQTGYNVAKYVDTASGLVSSVNPLVGLIGAGAAAAGRLIVGLGSWIFGNGNEEKEIENSENYLSDLCSFRDLTFKHDKLLGNLSPTDGKPAVSSEDYQGKIQAVEKQLADAKQQLSCSEQYKGGFENVQKFVKDVGASVEKPASQLQCLNFINQISAGLSHPENYPLQTVANRYGCFNANSTFEKSRYQSFCNIFKTLQESIKGDIYEKCENETFQKMLASKFISLTDILSKGIEDSLADLAPVNEKIKSLEAERDNLQKMRDEDLRKKISFEQFAGLGTVIESNAMTSYNTQKALTKLGREILGKRFNIYTEKTLDLADDALSDSEDLLEDLSDLKKSKDSTSFFTSTPKTEAEKKEIQQKVCDSIPGLKRKILEGYRTTLAVKDVCDFMKGAGIPKLNSDLTFDQYSADIDDPKKRLTSKCSEIYQKTTKNFTAIKAQVKSSTELGCANI